MSKLKAAADIKEVRANFVQQTTIEMIEKIECHRTSCPCHPQDKPFCNKEICFQRELGKLINRHSLENGSNIQNFVLAEYLCECLKTKICKS